MNPRPATPMEREANERSLKRLRQLFPRLPKSDVGAFLIDCTAFPFNGLQGAVEQAAELSRRCSKSVERAYLTVHRDMDREMNRWRRSKEHNADDSRTESDTTGYV